MAIPGPGQAPRAEPNACCQADRPTAPRIAGPDLDLHPAAIALDPTVRGQQVGRARGPPISHHSGDTPVHPAAPLLSKSTGCALYGDPMPRRDVRPLAHARTGIKSGHRDAARSFDGVATRASWIDATIVHLTEAEATARAAVARHPAAARHPAVARTRRRHATRRWHVTRRRISAGDRGSCGARWCA